MSRIRSVAVVFLFLCALSAFAFQSAPPPGGQGGQGRGRGPMNVEDQVKQLTERLNLTDDQQGKVKTILEEGREQMQKVRADDSLSQEDKMSKMRSLHDATTAKIRDILTDDQKKKFDALEQERRERMKQRQQGGGEPPK